MRSFVLVAAVLVGCALPAPQLAPAPSGLSRVVIEQPVNRTGGDLVVEGPDLFGSLIGERPSTVSDVLADDLRTRVAYQGFLVGKSADDDVPVLRTEIHRWEPYTADYSMVTVDVTAALVEPGSGRTLWTATRTNWNVPTSDARSRGEAFRIASATTAETLLAGWQPAAR